MTRHKRHLPLTTLPPKTWPFMRVIALTAKNNRFTHQADKTKQNAAYRTVAVQRRWSEYLRACRETPRPPAQ